MKEDARKIAVMQCVSGQNTREKFLLADQYTELDNRLVKKTINKRNADSIRNNLDLKKQKLIIRSQQKSDSLLNFLRKIWKEEYGTIEDKKILDSLTALELATICNANPL